MQGYAASFGLETFCLRYFNVFGPRQDPFGAYAAVIPAFVSRLLKGQPPVVYGDGEQTRDFCYIDNVCHANWLAANAPAKACTGVPVNIACNQRTSLNQILAQLGQLLGVKLKATYEPQRAGDVQHSLADISQARKVLGYEPQVYFEDGLARSIDWYRANLA
jgi:nucleoside-diphosphate-sugar epimerase